MEEHTREWGYEVLEVYLRSKYGYPGGREPVTLDEIPRKIVGKADVKAALASARRGEGCEWAIPALEILAGQRPLGRRESTGPLPHVRVSGFMSRHVETLAGWGILEPSRSGPDSVPCGLSNVPKKDSKERVIFDATPANRVLESSPGTLDMFGLADLLECWSRRLWSPS